MVKVEVGCIMYKVTGDTCAIEHCVGAHPWGDKATTIQAMKGTTLMWSSLIAARVLANWIGGECRYRECSSL